MNLILFLAGVFLLIFLIGRLLEKLRIPWIFSALLIGVFLSAYNPFKDMTSDPSFLFLSEMGMYFLLFIIGFELDIKRIFESRGFVIKTTIIIILSETVIGTLFVHYVFNASWLISLLVASSFATVGEAVLLPILDEFRMVKTKLGQTILGIGVLDDFLEVLTVIVASVVVGRSMGHTPFNIWTNLLLLLLLFSLVFLMVRFHKYLGSFKYKDVPSLFLFILFFLMLFIGIGKYVDSAALGALLAGMALKNIIPGRILNLVDSEIRTMAYGFFAPLFFLWVGTNTDLRYVISSPWTIIAIVLLISAAKIISSVIVGSKELGRNKSFILGTSLCVKFSTSIVIIKLLFENDVIKSDMYTVLIGATIVLSMTVPFLLSIILKRWGIEKKSPSED